MITYNIGGKRPRRTIFTQKTIINQSKCKIQSKIAAKGRSIDSKSIKNRRKSKKHRLKTGEKSVVEKSMAGTIFNSDLRVAQEACIKQKTVSIASCCADCTRRAGGDARSVNNFN